MGSVEVEILRDQYEAVNERDWERAMSHYADDVELVVGGPGIRAGRFKGKEEVGRWFGDWMATFDRSLHFDIREIRELDDGAIFLTADTRVKGKASGLELEAPIAWRYRLRDRKIVLVEGFESYEAAIREGAAES